MFVSNMHAFHLYPTNPILISSHPLSCSAGQLRPFRNAPHHPSLSLMLLQTPMTAIPSPFAVSFPSSRSFVACPVFFCLVVPRSVQFWLCYCCLSAGDVLSIFISISLSSLEVVAYWSICTVPHLRLILVNGQKTLCIFLMYFL